MEQHNKCVKNSDSADADMDVNQEDSQCMEEEDSANDVHKVDSTNDVKAIPRVAIPREASICSVGRHPACGYPA